jgi:hypothetical protein
MKKSISRRDFPANVSILILYHVDNHQQHRQFHHQHGGGKKPAGIGQIQIQIIEGWRYQGIERNRHGG